ncbi:hypothetical protein GSI_06157 [Ganoderma sinense ZZ0214-1]|uniref:Uncharacterized protein n=1 Tax=Ganoderma sinense ZZ0214-1 TaxID=1077348 RepID=A0A2G8SCF4_9APHY|nr:hypothetical protein GSI_06157 [Ganoderma sinense ZZ0214-1]
MKANIAKTTIPPAAPRERDNDCCTDPGSGGDGDGGSGGDKLDGKEEDEVSAEADISTNTFVAAMALGGRDADGCVEPVAIGGGDNVWP